MFEKTLTDLIQGLRANKRNEAEYIQRVLAEIQSEVALSDMHHKSVAVSKLNYLHMLGYDMNWANFNVVEVMASPRFGEKRTGYLAAAQTFHQETNVLMLTTNLMRKDLASANAMEVSVALDGLAQVATRELAQDLLDDVLVAAGHTRPYIRKKALVCACRLVERYPEGLSELLPLLRDRLDDADPAVVASAVSVVCELAHTDARSYLPLAPKLYRLLTTSANNWMLIKIVKLFAWLTPIEPRLARKLHAPLAHLVATTSAMSLLYECIHTAVVGGIIDVQQSAVDAAGRDIDFAALCARRLEQFYESRDHNLRYVGLVTLVQLQARRPELVAAHYATVLRCLDDPDTSIRMRAIEAIAAMATRKTLVSTVKRLMSQLVLSDTVALQPDCPAGATDPSAEEDEERKHVLPQSDATGASLVSAQGTIVKRPDTRGVPDAADSPEYRLAAVEAILSMCSRQSYANTSDFEWYVATLIDLVYVAGPIDIAPRLSERLLDVTVRVRQVRAFSVAMARRLLSDPRLLARATSDGTNAPVLATAAYILGEYCALQPSSADDIWLLLPRRLAKLADEQQAVFVQASMKVYVNWLRDVAAYWSPEVWEHVRAVTASTQRTLSERFLGTAFGTSLRSAAAGLPLQVASRLRMFAEAVNAVSLATSNMGDSAPHVCAELHVLFGAYELNPVSNAAQAKVPVPDDLDLDTFIADPIPDTTQSDMPPPSPPPAPRRRRTLSRSKDPFILPSVDDIPMLALQLDDDANHPPTRPHKTRKSKKKSRRKHNKPRSPSPPPATVDIAVDEDMPESAK